MWLLWQRVRQFAAKFHSKILTDFFLKLGFSPCKTEQPLEGMDLQGKEEEDKKHAG